MTTTVSSSNKSFASRSSLFIGIVLIGANLRAPITSLGPVLPDLQRALDLNGAAVGLLNALPLLVFALLSLVAPAFGRRYGLERVLAGALAAILVGTLVRSAGHVDFVWIGTLILSAGIAFGNVLLPALVKREFTSHAATLIGLYAAAMAGVAGLASGFAVPISDLPGADWRWSIGCWAGLTLLTLALWLPHCRGMAPRLGGYTEPGKAGRSPWRHPIGWQVSLFFALHSLVFYSLVDWYASYAESNGTTSRAAGGYLLIYQVVAVATNLVSAPIIRRSRDQRILGFSCGVLLLAGTLGLLVWPQLAVLWLACAGLGAGIAMVTSLSLFGLRTQDHQQAAELSGMAQFVGYAGAAAGPLLVGVLHDATRGWTWPMAFLTLASAAVVVVATLAGRRRLIG